MGYIIIEEGTMVTIAQMVKHQTNVATNCDHGRRCWMEERRRRKQQLPEFHTETSAGLSG